MPESTTPPSDGTDGYVGGMMRIRIHCRGKSGGPWKVSYADVGQIPAVGDFVAPAPIHVYRVVLTLHILFDADYAAEVFAEQADFNDVQLKTLGRVIWNA
jgi:hypothetical protein